MATGQFLIRNRHNNMFYGRVIIPLSLRAQFNGRRELRKSLRTTDKFQAKKRSLSFWVDCQRGFDTLKNMSNTEIIFKTGQCFKKFLSDGFRQSHGNTMRYIETFDALGRKHIFDLDSPEDEKKLAQEMHQNANRLLNKFADQPDILEKLLSLNDQSYTAPTRQNESRQAQGNQPESPTPFDEAVDLYTTKLTTQGRRGRKLSQRTLINYQTRLNFWKAYFNNTLVHEITLKKLSDVQNWLTRMPTNYAKKGYTTAQAIKMAQNPNGTHQTISDKTRAEYLGQLKGVLDYAHSCGFVVNDMARYIEIPNTKQSQSICRLPFTVQDLSLIFPGTDYGIDFGIQRTGLDPNVKFWFPLLAAFSGARLEEIAQLKTSDIKTCPDTGIIYANIADSGAAADGAKKHAKNKNSVRPIPIHSTLINIGFMDYVASRKSDKSDKGLFKLKRDKQGRLAKGVSNWFSRIDKRKDGQFTLGYIERRGVISKGTDEAGQRWSKSFHSFRHTAIDNLRGRKMANGEYIREPDIGLVVGHEKGKLETANYGADRSQLDLRQAVIEAIDYNGVGFDKIRWERKKR